MSETSRSHMTIHKFNDALFELSGPDIFRPRDLFTAAPHNARGFLFAVLEGTHVGRVFVDDAAAPTAALAHLACEFSFLLGDPANDAFAAAAHDLLLSELLPPPAPYGQLLFLVPTTQDWEADIVLRYSHHRLDHISRKTFTFDPDRFTAGHEGWAARLPTGFSLRRYDRALAESAGGIAEFWSSIDNFLENGFGFAVIHDDTQEVAARCHTVLCGAGEAEISIETPEAYRRRGLATLAACAFIDHALAQGMTPAWSCWFDNHASAALADRLGFVPAPDMPITVVITGETPPQPQPDEAEG